MNKKIASLERFFQPVSLIIRLNCLFISRNHSLESLFELLKKIGDVGSDSGVGAVANTSQLLQEYLRIKCQFSCYQCIDRLYPSYDSYTLLETVETSRFVC